MENKNRRSTPLWNAYLPFVTFLPFPLSPLSLLSPLPSRRSAARPSKQPPTRPAAETARTRGGGHEAFGRSLHLLEREAGRELVFDDWDQPPAAAKDLELYFQHLEQTLTELNFLTADNPRQTMTRLRRLFNRVRLDQMELSILRGMLTGIQNFIYHSEKRLAKAQAGLTPKE